jgi:hypothetical protein
MTLLLVSISRPVEEIPRALLTNNKKGVLYMKALGLVIIDHFISYL